MDEPDQSDRIYELFLDALDRPDGERRAFVERASGGAPAVAQGVFALLEAASSVSEDFLEQPLQIEVRGEDVPAQWGPYELSESIGRGGMGEVFRGRHRAIGRWVAIKVLNPDLVNLPDIVSRFEQEAGIVNTVRHPNIIDVTDFLHLEDPPRFGFVMELLNGRPLSEALKAHRFTTQQTLNVGWQILDALEAVHEAGVIHRDLKPDNIFVVGDLESDLSGVPSIKILDFGVAKASETTGHRTATGALIGTPAYMAPEQARGAPVFPATDLFAWGEIIYEMLTRERLYPGDPQTALRRKLLDEPPSLARALEGEDLAPLTQLLQRCLAVSPALRPSATEAKEVLTQLSAVGKTTSCTVVAAAHDLPAEVFERIRARHDCHQLPAPEARATVFNEAEAAIAFALDLRSASSADATSGVGIWTGKIYAQTSPYALTLGRAIKLLRISAPGQVLLPGTTAVEVRRDETVSADAVRRWVSHGLYELDGVPGVNELLEVAGVEDRQGPAPAPSSTLRRVGPSMHGWRPSPQVEIPSRPGWQLERSLGEGGFGEVWLGVRDGERHVFKFAFGEAARKTLEREVRLVGRLQRALGDRNDILAIVGSELDEAPYFIEARFVGGGDLKSWLRRRGDEEAPSLSTRLDLIAQIAEAVAAAHAVGVLHRDLKPSNILVEEDGSAPRIILADFGIGDVIDTSAPTPASASATSIQAVSDADPFADTALAMSTALAGAGTAIYMAPERLAGRPASLQSDIFALGVIMYQLLVGDLSRAVTADWPEDIEDELLREDLGAMLAGNPSHRLADANEVARRLRQLEPRREARAAEHRRAEAARRARNFRRVALPVGALLLAFGVAMAYQAQRIAREAERANHAANTASRVTGFLVQLFEVSDPGTPSAGKVTARDILDRGADRIRKELKAEPLIRAELMQTIGDIFVNLGEYAPALEITQESFDLRSAELGPRNVEVARTLTRLGRLQRLNSRYDAAEASLRQALDIYRATVGDEDAGTATALGFLAQITYLKGDANQARELYERSLSIRERVLGPVHVDVAESLLHLGWMDLEGRDAQSAERRLRRAVEIRRDALGADHFRVAEAMDYLAESLLAQARLEEAEAMTREALALRERTLGPNHRQVANSLVALARVLRKRDLRSEATEILQRAVRVLETALGAKHLEMGLAQFELGLISGELERWSEAVTAYRACLMAFEAAFGPEHPATAEVLNNLGAALADHLGQHPEAEPMLRRAVAVMDEGGDEIWRARTRASLANSLRDQTKYAEAETLYREGLDLLAGREGAEARSEHATIVRELGTLLARTGRKAAAKRLKPL